MILRALLPETILVVGALFLLTAGVARPAARGTAIVLAVLAALASSVAIAIDPSDIYLLGGMVCSDAYSRFFKQVLLILGTVSLVFAYDCFPRKHFAEALALVLFSLVGMMLLAGTEDLLMIFVALELTSIPLYVLAAFNKESRGSAEAGLKYFLVGSVSAAFLLYGFSLIYGVAGSTGLRAIAASGASDPLLAVGVVMALGGFAFKVAAVPFQLWAPDVYEGAPTPAAALIASGSKVASVFVLVRILYMGLGPWAGIAGWEHFVAGWAPLLAVMAAASIVFGNLAALVQSNVRRLLAYSAIAHGGYMLLALAAPGDASARATLFYVVVYAITALGAFGVVALVEKARGAARLSDFNGLARTSPALALSLAVFFVSLAGIPPMAGFIGKFYLFTAALEGGPVTWLVAVAVALNAVSLYYYLIVLKHVFVLPAARAELPIPPSASGLLVAVLAVAVLVLGLAPGILLGPLVSPSGTASTQAGVPSLAQQQH